MTQFMPRAAEPLQKLLAVAILAALPAASAWAQQPPADHGRNHGPPGQQAGQHGRPERRDNPAQGRRSLSDAVRRVERDTRGEVLSAERVQYDGRDMHRVKVVDDRGRVRVFMQDPRGAAGQQRSGNGGRDSRPTRRDDD